MRKLLLFTALFLSFALFVAQKKATIIDSLCENPVIFYTKEQCDIAAKATFIKSGALLLASTGAVKQPTMIKGDTIATVIMDTIKTDMSNDSVNVVWNSNVEYDIYPKSGGEMVYNGVYDLRYKKNFVIGDNIDIKTGEHFKTKYAINDNGTYIALILEGCYLDPGYASAPSIISGTFRSDSTLYNRVDTLGLWHQYPLNADTNAKVTADSAIGAVNATFVSTVFDSLGQKLGSGCAVFNGAVNGSGKIRIPDKTSFDASTVFSCGGWYFLRDTSNQQSLWDMRLAASSGVEAHIYTTAGKLSWYLDTSTQASNYVTCNAKGSDFLNKWVHVFFTFDNGTPKIYYNGISQALTTSGTIKNKISNDTIFIGGQVNNNRNIIGRADNFTMWKKKLTDEQVTTLYKSNIEVWHNYDTTSTGSIYIDTTGASCDSVRIINAGTTDSTTLAITANNRYSLFYSVIKPLTADSTYKDSLLLDTINISAGKQRRYQRTITISRFDTLRIAGVNNVGIGAFSRRKVQTFLTPTQIYKYDTLFNPTYTSITPATGTTAGGTAITIAGHYFYTTGIGVTIGGAAMTVTAQTDSTITGTTPAGTAGAQNIVITNLYGLTVTGTGAYTYSSGDNSLFHRIYAKAAYYKRLFKRTILSRDNPQL